MKKYTLPILIMAALTLSSCGVLDKLIGMDSSETTASAVTTTRRDRYTTTTRDYSVKDDNELTTTGTKAADEVDPEKMSRVSIGSVTTTKITGVKTNTTTTTTTRSAYSILQKPKSEEYFNMAKAFRTGKETELLYGPSKDYDTVKTLPKETPFSALAQEGKWYYVQLDGDVYGWVPTSCVEKSDKTTTTTKK